MTKIAIASDDGATIAPHFGRTRGFVVYSIKDNKIIEQEYRENNFTAHWTGQHNAPMMSKHNTIINALSDCKAIISYGMGRRLYEDLYKAGFEVFITDETQTINAAQKYIEQTLTDNPNKSCEGDNENEHHHNHWN